MSPQYRREPQERTKTRTEPEPTVDRLSSSHRSAEEESWAEQHRKEKEARESAERAQVEQRQRTLQLRIASLERKYENYRAAASPANAADRRFTLEAFVTEESAKVVSDVDEAAMAEFSRRSREQLGAPDPGVLRAVKNAIATLNRAFYTYWGKARAVLRNARIYCNRVPDVSREVLERMRTLCAHASDETTRVSSLARQSRISVLKDEKRGRTYLLISRDSDSFHVIELAEALADPPPPDKLLRSLNGVLSKLVDDRSPILWVDGDYEGVNFNQVLTRGPQFRVRDPVSVSASDNIAAVLAAPPLNSGNCRVLTGVPTTPEEMTATFDSQEGAGEWADEAERWRAATRKLGDKISTTPASRDTVLEALQTSANVIVVMAHSTGTVIRFPNGSTLTRDDLLAHKDAIGRNAPVVYLMCCEAGRISDAQSLADTLLEAGAKAVYAPLVKIGSTLKLFERFVKYGAKRPAAEAFARAENKTGNRELVSWVR